MITAIAFLIAFSGSVLLLILVARLWVVDRETKLSKHRSKEAGLADLLNYAAEVDNGIIIGKNGSLMAAWLYQGDDNASSTDEQREIVSYRINQALSGLGSGWMVHVDAARRNAPNYSDPGLSHFPDEITLAIDEERRRYFNSLGTMYEGFFVITVTYFPPILAQTKFVEMMFDDETETMDKKARTHHVLEQFRQEVSTIESRLSAVFKMERLQGRKVITEDGITKTEDDFLRYLHFCVTGLNHPVLLPNNPVYLDALIGGQELWTGIIPKIGRKFIQAISIEGFPMESYPGILSQLAELPVEYRWSSRFIFMDQHEAVAHVEKFRKKWRQKIRGFFDQVFNTNTGHIDQDAAAMVADAEAAIADINSGMSGAGYYTSVVILMDESRPKLEAAARQIEKALHSLGFSARVGGSRWTSEIAIHYYKTLLGIAISLMAMVLMIGIAQSIITNYYNQMSTGIQVNEIATIMVVAIILLALIHRVPHLISGVITGASIGHSGIGAFSAGAAIGAAAATHAMTSAGASHIGGGGQALKAAFQSAQQNMANRDASPNTSGSVLGGLASAMGTGKTFVADMGKSLAKGAGSTMKQSASDSASRSFFGRVANNIKNEMSSNAGSTASKTSMPNSISAANGSNASNAKDEISSFVNKNA